MKKLILILVLISCSILFAATGSSVSVQTTSPFKVIQQTSQFLDVEFNLPSYKVETEKVDGTNFKKIVAENAGQMLQPGMPDVPNYSAYIAIPYRGSVTTEIISTQNDRLQNFNPYPQQDLSTETPGAFRINRTYYDTGGVYPLQKITTSEPEILREMRIVNVTLNPFSYDAKTKSMVIDQKVRVRFHFNPDQGINEMEPPTSISASFEPIYRAQILNYSNTRDVALPYAQESIMMITPYTVDATFIARLRNLVDWKKQKGYLVTWRMLPAGPSNAGVKAVIQAAYDSVAVRPTYVILIGDASGTYGIPTWMHAWSSYNGEGDYPYTLLSGGDLLGDMLIGRISISSTTDFLTLTGKGFLYERDLDMMTATWLNRLLLVGDTSSSGISTIYTNKFIKEISAVHNPSLTYSEVYASPFPNQIDAGLTSGVGFFNYRGYINMSSWDPSSSAMANGYKVPHAVIITCATGSFTSTATTESFTRLGTEGTPKGAVTAIGMATSGTHTMLNNVICAGIFDGIYSNDMHTMGQALLNGKLYLHRIYHTPDPDLTEAFQHICNLIGDPTVEVFTGIPNEFTVRYPSSITNGSNQVEINVSDAASVAVANAVVTVYSRGTVHVTGLTDATGKCILIIPNNLAGSVTVTVSKQNFKPSYSTVAISTTGGLVYNSQVIDDDDNAPSDGNGNGIANAGEIIELQIGIKNTTAGQISSINGVLTTTSTGVTILTPNVSFGNVTAGSISTGLTKYLISLSQDVPDNTVLNFKITFSHSSGERYEFSFQVLTRNGDIDVTNVNVSDGGNGVLDAGETTNLILTIQNNGQIPTDALYAQLIPVTTNVTVSDDIAYFGAVSNGGTATCSANSFTITGKSVLVPGMVIPMNVRFYNSLGYSEIVPITLNIGVVQVTDPTGPDAFGHMIYDPGDTNYSDAPIYSWVEIATPAGGPGTQVALTDVGTSDDEGDQVGSTSIVTVNLPFTFRLYGRNYTQASICSNGFIGMGASADGEFRNYTLPGALGPNPMIAAFWDDLSLPSGSGVYQYYDSAQHYWVVEWYMARNGYNQTTEETFQAILYDPIYYPTSNGDGMIKLQYKVFNNIDIGTTGGYTPTHGNYATIGIKDHTGTDGLQYTFNNTSSTASATLGNMTALMIAGEPISHESAYLTISDKTLLDGNNNIIEPNETVQIGIELMNSGLQTAHNVSATISSADPYITFTTATASYADLSPDQSAFGLTFFQVHVASNTPNGYAIPVTMNVTCTEGTWQRYFSINVVKPGLSYDNYFINDQAGNNNGVPNSNESILLIVNTNNTGTLDIANVNMTLSTSASNVTLLDTSLACGNSAAGTKLQKAFRVNLGTIVNGTIISFNLGITGTNMTTISQVIQMTIGTAGMSTDFEANNGNFTVTTPTLPPGWQWGYTSKITENTTKVWCTDLVSNYPDNAQYDLFSPVIPLGTNATLSFWHLYCTEGNYDFGLVFISTDGGNNWTKINPNGGYPNNSGSIPAAYRPAYASTSTGVAVTGTATFDLSTYAGQNVMFKWFFYSDTSVNSKGWFIDNVVVSGVVTKTGRVTGTITLSPTSPSITNTVVKAGVYATHPASNGTYTIYLPNGTYPTSAALTGYSAPAAQSKTISDASQTQTANFTMEFLTTPPTLTYTPTIGSIPLNWSARDDRLLNFQHYNVWKRINADSFYKIAEVTAANYTDTPTINGTYSYYVTTDYTEGESAASNIVTFTYPPAIPTIPNAVTQVSPAAGATGVSILPTVTWTPNNRTTVTPNASRSAGTRSEIDLTPRAERSLVMLDDRDPATDYYVYCDTSADPTTLIASPTASPYTFTTPLTYSTTYYWKVVAHNAVGVSTGNTIRSFTTIANPNPPNPVTLVSPADVATGLALLPTVSWTPPATGAPVTVYYVYCDTNADPTTLVGSPTSSPFTFTTALAYSTNYKWKVVAHNANGNSTSNTIRSFTTMADPTPPNPVTQVSPAAAATGIAALPTLTWTPAATGTPATDYYVYCDTNADPTTLVGSPTASPYTLGTALSYSTTYYWKVVAHNANGISASNTVRSFTTQADPNPPNPVTLLTPVTDATGLSSLPTVTWSAAVGGTPATSYYIYCDTNANPTANVGTSTTTSFTFTTALNYSTNYKWKVVARNANGYSINNTVWTFTTMTNPNPPNPPTLNNPASNATSVPVLTTFSWTPAATGATATGYYVYCDTSTYPSTLVGSPTAAAFTLTTPLAYSTTYRWRVIARNANGNSAYSATRVFTTIANPNPPDAVTLVSPAASATGISALPTLSWTPAATGAPATSYLVYCDTNTNPSTLVGSPTTASFTLTTPLAYSTAYRWKVIARNANGNSGYTVRAFTTMADPTPPNPVTLATPADAVTGTAILPTVSWSPAGTGTTPTVYYVYCDTNANPTTLVGSPTASPFTFTTSLSYFTTYYWKVVAGNANGSSSNNTVRSFTTMADPNPPNPVTLSAPADAATGVALLPTVSWTPAVTGTTPTVYYVYCDTNASPTTLVGSPTASPFTFTTELSYSTTYYWKVVAGNTNGNSIGNTVRSFTTMADPTPPNPVTLTAPSNGASNVISMPTLSWDPAGSGTPATVYYVYCDTNMDPTTLVDSPTTTSFTFTTPLAYASTYYWKVVAHNVNGNSVSNTVWSFSTAADLTPLSAPDNVVSTITETGTQVSWNTVSGAVRYHIYAVTDPSAVDWGTPIATVEAPATSWIDIDNLDHRFYRVTADNQ